MGDFPEAMTYVVVIRHKLLQDRHVPQYGEGASAMPRTNKSEMGLCLLQIQGVGEVSRGRSVGELSRYRTGLLRLLWNLSTLIDCRLVITRKLGRSGIQ